MNYQEINLKLEKLREEYKTAGVANKKIIEIRGKLLNIALQRMMKKQQRMV